MTNTSYVIILIVLVFIAGFDMGRRFMIRGLMLRTQQLYEEGDIIVSRYLERVLKEDEDDR